ncbi:hypothetical protein PQR34_48465 [Paraburkholderia sediminicola]|uniref:hypothetical protein n=1 Tax=Paraburkholderia sediminicola TaxID=458836 RepID=UPI0038BAECFA
MIFRKSLLFTALFSAGCAALSAYINLAGAGSSPVSAQPDWMIELHIGSAFLGAILFTMFVLGSSAAFSEPAEPSTYGVGLVPSWGTVRFPVPGRNSFFSVKRSIQLLGFLACLMIQFISVQTTPEGRAPSPHREQAARPNASKGNLQL